MSSNAIFFGWNRALPGREHLSAQHFQDFVAYLSGLQEAGAIDAFEFPPYLQDLAVMNTQVESDVSFAAKRLGSREGQSLVVSVTGR